MLVAGNKRSVWRNPRENGDKLHAPKIAYVLVVYAAYSVAAQADHALGGGGVPVLSLADAALMAALLGPPRTWRIFVAGAFAAHIVAELANDGSLALTLAGFVANSLPTIGVVALLRRLRVWPPHFQTLRETAVFIPSACVLPSLIGASFQLLILRLMREDPASLELWSRLLFSKALSFALVIPLVVSTVTRLGEGRKISWQRFAEGSLLYLGIVVSTWVAFRNRPSGRSHWSALICGPLPFLIWAAARFGVGGTSACLLLLSLCAAGFATQGRGPFAQLGLEEGAHALQIFLATVSVPMLALATLLRQRSPAGETEPETLRDDFKRRLSEQVSALDELKRHVTDGEASPHAIMQEFERVTRQAAQLEKEFSLVANAMRKPDVPRQGFEGILRAFCRDFGASANLRVNFTFEGRGNTISTNVAWCCFRVVHTGLGYAARHARATEAQVKIASGADRLFLTFAENGTEPPGLDVIESEASRLKRCVESLSGDFRIAKREARGTLVMVVLPI